MKDVYEKVDDIDLMLGGVAERNVRGGAVGATFACIIGEQFRRLKYGDRYFYTHIADKNRAKGLSHTTKSFVLQRTLGDILCDNTAMEGTQKWVTLQPDDDYNAYELCSTAKRTLDLKSIAKEITGELPRESRQVDNGRIPRGPQRFGRKLQDGPVSPACLRLGCDQV